MPPARADSFSSERAITDTRQSAVPATGTGTFAYFLFITGMNGLLGNLVGYFIPIYFKELGFSGLQVGSYFAVASVATILLSLPMGVTTDRKPIVAILMGSLGLIGLSKLGFVLTRAYWLFLIFALVGSIGGRFYNTAITTLFYKMTGRGNERRAGLYQLVSFTGMSMGMVLGGLLIATFNFHTMFLFAFVANFALMALAYFLPRNESVVIRIDDYKKAVLRPNVLFLTLIFTLSSMHWGAETTSYGPFLKNVLGLDSWHTALYTASGFLFVGLGAYGGFLLLDRRIIKDPQTLLATGFFLSGLFHILMCVHNVPLSFGFRVFHEIGDGFIALAFYNGITRMFHLDRIGGCAAFITLWQAIGSMGSALAFGMIGERFGHQWPLIISGIIMALLPVLLRLRGGDVLDEDGGDGGNGPAVRPGEPAGERATG